MAFHEYPYPCYDWEYQGVDFAIFNDMSAELAYQMADDGIAFVGRYLWPDAMPNGKGLSKEEMQLYYDAGIAVYCYFEINIDDALQGFDHGVNVGEWAKDLAEEIELPENTMIFCCCDTAVDLDTADGVVMDYLRGFAQGLTEKYSAGIYGGANVMQACYNADPAFVRCQAGAWGDLEFDPINVRQWYINRNHDAYHRFLKLHNITLDENGYAQWRGHSVDLCSAPSLDGMAGGTKKPRPMPLWYVGRIL